MGSDSFEHDFFISHASEDKDAFVRPLAQQLRYRGARVWYDEFSLHIGDSLLASVDAGLLTSRFGIVILSPSFFGKAWPRRELDGLMALSRGGRKVVLPVWLGVTKEDVELFSPVLAGIVAGQATDGLEAIVDDLYRALDRVNPEAAGPTAIPVGTPVSSDSAAGHYARAGGPREGIQANRQREAMYLLSTAADDFIRDPPALPRQVVGGQRLVDWLPVYEPILAHFGPAMDATVEAALTLEGDHLRRLMRGVRNVFEVRRDAPDSWTAEAPRLVCRSIADQLMVHAYCTNEWERLQAIGDPMFTSHAGRSPWVLASEYRHLQTLNHHAGLSAEFSLQVLRAARHRLGEFQLLDRQLAGAFAAICVGTALAAWSRTGFATHRVQYGWGLGTADFWLEMTNWEEEPGILDTFGRWAGVAPQALRANLARYLEQMVGTEERTGRFFLVPDEAWAAVRRIAESAA